LNGEVRGAGARVDREIRIAIEGLRVEIYVGFDASKMSADDTVAFAKSSAYSLICIRLPVP